jgi:hypothetical protein
MIFAIFFYIFFFFIWMIAKLATTNKNSFEKKTLIWRNPMAATRLPAIPLSRPLAAPPILIDSTP